MRPFRKTRVGNGLCTSLGFENWNKAITFPSSVDIKIDTLKRNTLLTDFFTVKINAGSQPSTIF